MDGRKTLWVKHLYCKKGFHIDLHKFVGVDDEGCFHSHPAWAVRLVLWGGYVEELSNGRRKIWFPGMLGLVRPKLSHRIVGLRNGRVSYSLWVRFRKCAKIELSGSGWVNQKQTHRVKDTIIIS